CRHRPTLPSFGCYVPHRHLHSFPTRRSSDLRGAGSAETIVARRSSCEGSAHDATAELEPTTYGWTYGVTGWASAAGATSNAPRTDRKSTRLNSSHGSISYAVFCLKKKKKDNN